jgi:hypothetical protein
MKAYCVKCRASREEKDPRAMTMKNGKPATQGVCYVCVTRMFRIGKARTEILRSGTSERLGISIPSLSIFD